MKQGLIAYALPRLRDMLFTAVFIGGLLLGPRMLNIDTDLGRHLAMGNYILDHRHIPTRNLLSYTLLNLSRPPYEWGAQLIFAFANRLAGLDSVIWVSALVIASAFTLVYMDASRRSGWPLAALVITFIAAAAASLHWLPRPHVFTFFLLAIWLERLERVRCRERLPLWQFPLLMSLWANLHGGFIFGILIWFAYLAGWLWKRLRTTTPAGNEFGKQFFMIGSLSLAASVITPSGWGNWRAVLSNNSRYILSQTVETMPPNLSLPNTWPFLLVLILSLLFLATKRLPAAHVFLLGGLGVLSLFIARTIPLFVIAAAPILAEATRNALTRFQAWTRIEQRFVELQTPLRGAVWPLAALLAAAFLIGAHYHITQNSISRFDPQIFPVRAADWLLEHPQQGNMFNDFNWGGYLLYRLWPLQRVFIDSQTDFYGEQLVRDYQQIITAKPGWDQRLIQYRIEWVMIPFEAPLAQALRAGGWQELYEDTTTVILRRPTTP